ncbi:hypothetical protein B0H11DRAFT_1924717 [Mycena galericulata]|nr:hypothetical protein B0H11DRAFT_1924717 [Mycena galericulata]
MAGVQLNEANEREAREKRSTQNPAILNKREERCNEVTEERPVCTLKKSRQQESTWEMIVYDCGNYWLRDVKIREFCAHRGLVRECIQEVGRGHIEHFTVEVPGLLRLVPQRTRAEPKLAVRRVKRRYGDLVRIMQTSEAAKIVGEPV